MVTDLLHELEVFIKSATHAFCKEIDVYPVQSGAQVRSGIRFVIALHISPSGDPLLYMFLGRMSFDLGDAGGLAATCLEYVPNLYPKIPSID